ncbi:MAG: thiamine phosphate synthase [Thermoguttaceae bacterium]|nr:thiamine phosphate synthase [Thermoguttaceae bacterium]
MSKREIYRILDAAANRGREALRVVEDAVRFLDDNEELASALKEARHRFAAAADRLDRGERLLARDTVGDVGAALETEDEYRRASLVDILTANFARLQESARSLEEFSKIVAPELAREWEQIRYESYTLEKLAYEAATRHESNAAEEPAPETAAAPDVPNAAPDVPQEREEAQEEEPVEEPQPAPSPRVSEQPSSADAREQASNGDPNAFPDFFGYGSGESLTPRAIRRERLAKSALCAYVDRPLSDADAATLFQVKVDMFQIVFDSSRQSESAETAQLFLSQYFGAFPSETNVMRRPLLLSRGFAVWGAAFDGGVALEQNYREIREEIGDDLILGATVSTLDEALAAIAAGKEGVLDFIEAGPVFPTAYRAEGTGSAFLRAIMEAVDGRSPIPIFAYGGITADNCNEIFDSGIERIGVGAAILDAQDKRDAAMRLTSLF